MMLQEKFICSNFFLQCWYPLSLYITLRLTVFVDQAAVSILYSVNSLLSRSVIEADLSISL